MSSSSPLMYRPRSEAIASADAIASIVTVRPHFGIILGSGLGGIADKIEDATSIPFADIPGFAITTARGHRGQLILGTFEDVPVVAMAGRFHRYEGWRNDEVSFPVEVMRQLGVERLIVSNAAGGVNPKLRVGDMVVIAEHINLSGGVFGFNQHDSSLSTRMTTESLATDPCYDEEMSLIAMGVSLREDFNAYRGIYLATLGPTYETRAEYRMMRRLGADVVGMSTVPEVLTANRLGMRVLGLSMVSNVADPDRPVKADHDEVLHAGQAAEVKMEAIVRSVLEHTR